MSRFYEMKIIVRRVDPARAKAVKETAENCWDFDDWFPLANEDDSSAFQASGYGNLCGGEQENEFADRLAQEIWTANGSYCEVEVRALCFEDLPYESYTFDEDDFAQLAAPSQVANESSSAGEP